MFCKYCGKPVKDGARFCENCGAQVPAARKPAAQATQAAQLAGVMKGVAEMSAAVPLQPEELSETFSLTKDSAVTREKYNLILAGVLLWGFLMNVLFCILFADYVGNMGYGVFVVAYILLAIPGIIINVRSSKPIWSFVGYNMVVLPLGIVLSALLYDLGADVVRQTFEVTAAVTAGMFLLSSWKPEFFMRIGPCLLGALGLTLVAELVMFFVHYDSGFQVTNIVVAVIFCGYIGYDWAKAQQRPTTVDNAIDSACALYLDIINLMLRLLASRSRDDD